MIKHLLTTLSLAVTAVTGAFAAVPSGWKVTPDDGSTVEEIKSIVISKNRGNFDTYVNRKIKINDKDYAVSQKVTGTYDDVITLTLTDDAITEPGTYNIVIPENTFDYNYSWMMDEGDPNPEISFTWTIEGDDPTPPEPPTPQEFEPIDNPDYIISPEQAKVGQIKDLNVTYKRSGMFPEHYGSKYPVLVNEATNETVATFNVVEGGGYYDVDLVLSEAYTTPGIYLVQIPDGCISDFDDDDWPAVNFRYQIDNDIPVEIETETVIATPESDTTVSTLSSVLLYFPGMSEVYASGPEKDNCVVKCNGENTEITAKFNFSSTTMDEGEIGLVLDPPVTEAGEYSIYVPARALSLGVTAFDTRYNYEFTLNYTVKGVLAEGTKITVEPLTYKVVSGEEHTLSVTFPADESEYSNVTEVPAHVTYEGDEWTVVEIGKLAFSEVRGISKVTIPETVTTIGEAAFWESTLSEIEIPATVTTLGESAFEETSLKEFTIPETVTTIGSDLLSGCTALKTINLSSTMTEIPDNFAWGCSMLDDIKFPDGISKIGKFAFAECAALTKVELPEDLEELGAFAFSYTPELKSCPVPDNIKAVGHGVFYQSGLTSASLPETITVIPDGMYQCCASLPEFTVSDAVTEIEKEAFFWCFALTDITLGEKVETLGADVFKGDEKLINVTSKNTTPPTGAEFEQTVYTNATLSVPAEAIDAYKEAEGWKEFAKIKGIGESESVNVVTNSFSVTAVAGGLKVVSDSAVKVYDATGATVYSGEAGVIALPAGFYIVSSSDKTVKISL